MVELIRLTAPLFFFFLQKEIPIGRWVSRNLTWKYKADDQYEGQGGEERGVMHPDTG